MSSNFASAMRNTTETWNGALSLATPDASGETTGRVSLFFKGIRGLSKEDLGDYIAKALEEDVIDTFVLCLMLRDCRGGKGERSLGRLGLQGLLVREPEKFKRIMELIPEFGRWDDLFAFFPGMLTLEKGCLGNQSQAEAIRLVAAQLSLDKENMLLGKPVSLCAKWCPTENNSLDKKHQLVYQICLAMGISQKQYRKEYTTPLRSYLNIVEKFMCERKWSDIDFSTVPSCAMNRLKKAFARNAPETFESWKTKLLTGEKKVCAKQMYPHELIAQVEKYQYDAVCEAQWKVLEDEVEKLGSLSDAVIVVDVSMSMWGLPIQVATALGLLISHAVKGPFHNHVITFDSSPTFVELSDGNLMERHRELRRLPWGGWTDIKKVFNLILHLGKRFNLSQEDMPKKLFIISVMQFNQAGGNKCTNFEEIEAEYQRSGYERPQIVFWNVNGRSKDFPVSSTNEGTALISGFSPAILKSILEGDEFTPYAIMRRAIADKRYDRVRDRLK